jgi:tRNA(fMet)-specific endonuclease VapC
MLRYLLDTDTCIYVIRNRPASVRARFEAETGRLAMSSVTMMELLYGAEKSTDPPRNRDVVARFAAPLEVLDFDVRAALHAGEIRAGLERAGTPIGGYDLMIAGHARSRGLVLIANNLREFVRVGGLQVESWA